MTNRGLKWGPLLPNDVDSIVQHVRKEYGKKEAKDVGRVLEHLSTRRPSFLTTRPAHLNLLDLITLTILGERYKTIYVHYYLFLLRYKSSIHDISATAVQGLPTD